MRTVNLTDFEGSRALDKLRAAADYLREHPAATLLIPPGTYILRDPEALKLREDVLAGAYGNAPSDSLYRPYHPYVKGLSCEGMEDVTISAYGATFLVDGFMEPVSVEHCRNVAIEGLTIDHLRKPFSEGDIVRVDESAFDIRFDSRYPVNTAIPTMRVMVADRASGRFYGGERCCGEKEWLGDNTLRFHAEPLPGMLGQRAVVPHTFHYRPAVLLREAKNTRLTDVTIHSQPGMGIVGMKAEDITIRRLRIVPSPGCRMSTNTDATNFAVCKGELVLEDCQFEGHGDDAINVHGYYYDILEADGNRCVAGNTFREFNHAQVLETPDPGDIMELTVKDTLEICRSYTVREVVPRPESLQFDLVLDEDLPGDTENYFLANATRLPRLRFLNCHCGTHRARSVLAKTRDVLIEGCTFMDSTGPAIQVAAEGSWHESISAADVTIRRNRFLRSGSGWGPAILVNIDCAGEPAISHRNLCIEDNLIDRKGMAGGIAVSAADGVLIRNNRICCDGEPIAVANSQRAELENNQTCEVGTME